MINAVRRIYHDFKPHVIRTNHKEGDYTGCANNFGIRLFNITYIVQFLLLYGGTNERTVPAIILASLETYALMLNDIKCPFVIRKKLCESDNEVLDNAEENNTSSTTKQRESATLYDIVQLNK